MNFMDRLRGRANKPQVQYSNVFSQDFQLSAVLGSGQFGAVSLARSTHTQQEFAVKVLEWRKLLDSEMSKPENLKSEMALLKFLKHPGIIGLEQIYSDQENLYLVMEYARGGDLLDRILNRKHLPELEAKFFIWQVLVALLYLHTQPTPIAHRDLKPENVLLLTNDDWTVCKLCDFGFARLVGENSFMKSVVGTRAYVAPEVLTVDHSEGYNLKVDLWSLGVIAYVALSGTFPFRENDTLTARQLQPNVLFPPQHWAHISNEAKTWILRAFQINKEQRFSAAEALQDVWLSRDRELKERLKELEARIGERDVMRLKEFMKC